MLGLPYDSEDAFDFGERVMSFLEQRSEKSLSGLAKMRGAFPNFKGPFGRT